MERKSSSDVRTQDWRGIVVVGSLDVSCRESTSIAVVAAEYQSNNHGVADRHHDWNDGVGDRSRFD